MTSDELFTVMRDVVMMVTGVPNCLLADQNKPAPRGAYATIRPKQSITQRGQALRGQLYRPSELEIDKQVHAQIKCECSVNFYRGSAIDYAEKLKQANKRSNISALLFKKGIGWNRTGAVHNLTALQDKKTEQRAQISIFVMYETSDEFTINSIEVVDIELQKETGETIQTFQITET